MIKFNETSSGTLGVYVEKYPVRPVPQRKQEVFSVPGLSGDVIVAEDAWENVEQDYDIYVSAEAAGLPAVAGPAVAWLHGAKGYARLEDDYNPDIFRMAAFAGPADLANILNAFGRATVKFNCKPQRFLKSGETPIAPGTVTESGAVVTFDAGTAGASITDLSAEINAVQSFNGYSKPWAGGTGKNMFLLRSTDYSKTLNGLDMSYLAASESFTISGLNSKTDAAWILYAPTMNLPSTLTPGETYYFSHNLPEGFYAQITYNKTGSGAGTLVYRAGTGAFGSVSFTVPSNFASTAKFQLGVPASARQVDLSGLHFCVSSQNIAAWEPYENVCPITGFTGMTVSQSGQDTSNPTDTAIDWTNEAGTVYGGTLDVTTGALTVTHGNIASYAGETLPGAWLSSLDEYTPGGTPTTGAQVVYELASALSYSLTGVAFVTLLGENNFWANTGDVTVVYPAGGASLVNPTGFPAKPMITVHGSSSGTVTIGAQTVTISTITDGMFLDCELEEAYAISGGVVSNLNSVVSGSYPVLGAGESAVSWTGGVTGLSIVPRWYEL